MSYARQAVTRMTLDMGLPDVQRSITVTHGDTNRRLEVSLIDRGQPFALPPRWTVALAGALPGGDELYETCIVAEGRILFDFVGGPALSSEVGMFPVSFDIFDEGGEVVASPKVYIHVVEAARSLKQPETLENLTAIKEFVKNIGKVDDRIAELQAADEKFAASLRVERITVPVTEWTDASPYEAFVYLPDLGGINDNENTKAYAALLIPMNEATRAAAQETELVIDTTYVFAGGSIQALLKRQDAAPEVPLEFAVVAFTMDNETGASFKVTAAFVGVSALPEGLKKDVDALRDLTTVSGSVTLPVSTWSDGTPHESMTFVEDFGAGMTALLYPADEESKRVAVEAGLSARPTVTEVGEEGVVWLIRAEAGTVPTVPITLDYVMVKTGSDAAPKAVLLGVDAVGGGGSGGADEATIGNIVKKLVPSWAMEEAKPGYTPKEIGLGNVANVRQYSVDNPPPYPVVSVNGKTGALTLSASDVGARHNTWMPTAADVGARPVTWTPTAADVGADPAGTAASRVGAHNTSEDAHNDIRLLIQGLADRVNAVLDSDDSTLDEMSEIVSYIKSNKSLIDSITTSKVNVTDIVNNLTTNVAGKPLSAAQGVALKALFDGLSTAVSGLESGKVTAAQVSTAISTALTSYLTTAKAAELYQPKGSYQPAGDYLTPTTGDQRYAKPADLPTKTSQLTNDSNFATTAKAETWTFTLKSGSTVTKKVVLA